MVSHSKLTSAFLTIFMIMIFSTLQAEGTFTRAEQEAVLQEVARFLEQSYVFPETAAKMNAHVSQRMKKGEYDSLRDPDKFADALSEDLRSISKDLHLRFQYNPEQAQDIKRLNSRSPEEVQKTQETFRDRARKDNFGFRKVERLKGNIGYLDFRYFASAAEGGPTAIAAINFLSNCDAIIIDLRQNGGGDPTLIQLISSYFFSEPTHLNDIYERESNRTENYWTFPYVPGKKLDDADLYVLTSKFTFSGAEEFSYNLKSLKRATLIGETTGGGAHPVNQVIVQEKFVLTLPFARAINPITKTNWEGTGVTPDISVPADQAFDRAYIMALEKLSAKTTDPTVKSALEWSVAAQKAKSNPVLLTPQQISRYPGVYEDRKVTLENGVLHYQRRGPKYKMIPLSETTFILDGADDIRFEFVIREGKASELIGIYSDGSKEPSFRTG